MNVLENKTPDLAREGEVWSGTWARSIPHVPAPPSRAEIGVWIEDSVWLQVRFFPPARRLFPFFPPARPEWPPLVPDPPSCANILGRTLRLR